MFCHNAQAYRILRFLFSPSELLLSAITHSRSLIHPQSASVLSPPTCFTLSTNSPNCIALAVSVRLCYPTNTVLSRALFLPICFLFSAVSSTALLCFSSSDPTLEHLREIRRKLDSENLQLKAPVPCLPSRSQRNSLKHSDLVCLCLWNKLLVTANVQSDSLMRRPWASCHCREFQQTFQICG